MKKILFANTYFYPLDNKQWSIQQPYPPLGTLYAAAVMRSANYNVSLHDVSLLDSPLSILQPLHAQKPDYLILYDDGFNYLTKMCLTVMRDAALQMLKAGKEHNCITIICSSDSTDHYKLYLENGADYVIRGEGEQSLLELVKTLDRQESPLNVEGIAFKLLEGFCLPPPRPVSRQLDLLPFPAWDLVRVESYRQVWEGKGNPFYLNIATTRGCPYKCNWCAKPIYGNRYNSRSPENVVAELKYLYTHFGVDHFWMCDDIFGLKPGWVSAFAKKVEQENLNIQYKIQSRADLVLEENTVNSFVSSGLDEAWLGAESGSQKILDAMDKGIRVEQIYKATSLLKSKGVKVGLFIQFGYLGETLRDIRKTIRMVIQVMPDSLGISISYPLPGTLFYEKVKEDLKRKSNWKDSDDLAMMFRNTYSPSFYKILHSFLHALYATKKARLQVLQNLKELNPHLFRNFMRWGYHLSRGLLLGTRLRIASLI